MMMRGDRDIEDGEGGGGDWDTEDGGGGGGENRRRPTGTCGTCRRPWWRPPSTAPACRLLQLRFIDQITKGRGDRIF